MLKVSSVLELMKNTPLVALKGREASRPRASLWAKLELSLPGAMKDRVALKAVEDAEASGRLKPGGLIVESTSGTMGEGLARVASLKGYELIIITDPRLDQSSVNKLRALGARVDIVDNYHPTGGWQQSRLERLREVLRANPGAFWPRQYDTPSNPEAYTSAVATELLEAFGPRLGALVGTVGSGGSLSGTAAGLRKLLPGLRVVAVDAVGSVQFNQPNRPRLQSGHSNSIIAGNINYRAIDEVHWLSDGEAFGGCWELARREGIFGGGSSGAAYVAASWVAEQLEPDQHVVIIMPDRGDRYGETIYSESFLTQKGIAGVQAAAQPMRIRYGVDVAERWSYAPLPHDGSVPYYASTVKRSVDLMRELGLE
ncbi:cysteine synthase family protein [Hyalangium rubrum]|uniref:Cysteine synthase family protein n=1 Tax=Hyalangium rubrum TaxID=3103134 RepID=A0ABU5GVC5_9BACT|nr:cysteine synthase family protein [Hyalangium sp. s54d21]MDY7225125.1 cysteine synthase family protein [Hyalangium sp. s54d21]